MSVVPKKGQVPDDVLAAFGQSTKTEVPDDVLAAFGHAPPSKKKDDFPLLYNRAKTSSMAALVDGSHPLSSDGLLKPMTEKTIKKNERPFDIPADEIKSEAQNKIADIMYGDNEDWKDPLKVIDKGLKESKDVKTTLVHSAAKDIAKESLLPDGFEAKRILGNSIWGQYGDDNHTAKALREKANEYDKKTQGLRSLEQDAQHYSPDMMLMSFKNEAVKQYADKDPQFKRNLESQGIDLNDPDLSNRIPSVKMGGIEAEFLNDKDNVTYLQKEQSNLLPTFDYAHKTLLTDNKDFGINHVANKVSQAIQESGYNNIEPIFNYNSETSKGFANDVAGRVLTPQELEIYNQNIRDNQEQYLDKPSFFEGVASGIKDVYKGVGSTLEAPFQSQEKNIKDQWVKEASNVSANPEGLLGFVRGAGRGAGFVMGLLSGAEVLGGASAAHQAMIGATVFGDALKEAETKYKSPVKAWTSAGLQTLGFMYFNNIFPSAKVGQLFNAVKPEINDIAVSLAKGEISQQAAKTGLTKVLESAGKGLKQNISASAQMTALVGVNRMADKMFGLDPQTYEKYNSQSLPSVFGHFFLDNSVVSGLAGHSEASRERKLSEQTLMAAAQSPRQVERSINEQDPANKEELLNTVKHVEAVHKELIKNNVPEKKQGSYLLHSVAEKANKELAEQSTDPTIKAKYTDLAKKSHEIKEGILKGIPEDLIKQNQAIKEVKELYNEGFLGKQSMELLESKKTETSEPKFDEEKVKDYLKYVAQQSNNINEKGEFNTGSDARKSAEKTFPSQLKDLANEMFPEYAKTAGEFDADKKYEAKKPEDLKSTSVIMPEENKVAENIPLTEGIKSAVILPEENKVAEVVPLKKPTEVVDRMEVDNVVIPEGIEKEMFWQEKLVEHVLNELGIDYKKEGSKSSESSYYRLKTKDGTDFKLRVSGHNKKYASDGNVQYNERTTPQEIMDRLRDEIPDEIILRKSTSVIQPEENKVADIIPLKKANETTEIPIEAKEESGATQTANQIKQPSEEGAGVGEEKNVRLTHADTEQIYKEAGLPERLDTPTKHREQLEVEAEEKLKKGYDFDKVADQVMEGKYKFEDADQLLFARKVADLKAKQEELDIKSPEFEKAQNQIERLSRASDVAGTEIGRALQSRKNYVPVDETISDYVTAEKQSAGVETLTDNQKETVKKEYEDISEAKKKFDEYMAQKESDFAAKMAKAAFEKQKSTTPKTKKTHEDHVEYRKKVIEDIREKLKKARGDTQATIVPYAKELIAIAPDVAKLMKDLVEEGISKLEDVVSNIHGQLKDVIPQLQEKDVHDIIAGVYNEKKQPRSELARKAFELKREAQYVNKLFDLLSGEEPKTEKAKIERNKQIVELKKHIKNISEFEKDVEKQKSAKTELAAKEKAATEKGLTKAETEIDKSDERATKERDAAEEKERKRLQREAEVERKGFEREFEKEKRAEEKAALKLKLDEAKRIERELSYKTPEERGLASLKTRMTNEIKELEYKLKTGDFDKESAPAKPPLKLDEEGKNLKDKLVKLKQDRQIRLLKQEYANRSPYQKATDKALEVLNVPRTLMSSMDYSAPLRQGLIASISHPRTAGLAGIEMFRQSVSQKRFDRWFYDLKESKNYKLMQESELYVSDPHDPKLSAKEEAFMNNLAEKIPLVGKLIKGSERAYVGYLNKLRVDLFNRFAERYMSFGKTIENSPELYKQMADYVNNSTGRGKLGFAENAAPMLNSFLFSPRLIASRINLLTKPFTPSFYTKTPKEIRVMYAKDMLKFIGLGMTVLAIAKLNGAEVEDDPRSTDFGKIKSGNTRWDIWGGFQPYVRVFSQMATGEKKNVTDKQIKELNGEKAFGETRGDVLTRFARGKLAPVPSMVWDFLSNRTVTGDKPTIGSEAESHLLPLLYSDVKSAMQDKGVSSLFTVGVPSAFGVGVQTFEAKPAATKKQSKPHRQTRQ